MRQLVVRTWDEAAAQFVAAYTVCVAGRRVLAQAVRPEWADTARRLEVALNSGPAEGGRSAADSVQR